MRKVVKIIAIIFTVCFVISTVSAIMVFKNWDTIMGLLDVDNNFINKQIHYYEEQTQINEEVKTEPKTTTDTTVITTNSVVDKDVETLKTYIGKPLEELIVKVNELGYTATYLAQGEDFTSFIDSMKDLYLTGNLEIDSNKKTVVVELVSKSSVELDEQKKSLEEKLSLYRAWQAVEDYGKLQYIDFEVHSIKGKISESIENENTWSLKATCEVFGVKKTCEAKVTGTSDNPEVIDFYVY